VGLLFVAYAFLGLGLLIAALADNVPAVQALGQCLFLPMIMIGGVGVPLAILPVWAQRLSGFMPGRYAVDVLQRGFTEPTGLTGAGFSLLALVVIGTAAGLGGLKFFRWDAGRPKPRAALGWAVAALLAWAAVGLAALLGGRLPPVTPTGGGYTDITLAQMNQITYEDLPGDNEFATRLAKPLTAAQAEAMGEYAAKLRSWPPAGVADPAQSVINLLSVAAIADLSADLHEAELARLVFEELQARHGRNSLRQILAWIILHPEAGEVVTFAPELGLRRHPLAPYVRERNVLYAKKFLGRLLGKIPD
jgi:ABC-2 type transport system permease protein